MNKNTEHSFLYRIVSRKPVYGLQYEGINLPPDIKPREIITVETLWAKTSDVVLRSSFLVGRIGGYECSSCDPWYIYELNTECVYTNAATCDTYTEAKQELVISFFYAVGKSWSAFIGYRTEEFYLKSRLCYQSTVLDSNDVYALAKSRVTHIVDGVKYCYNVGLCDAFDGTFMYLMNDRRTEIVFDELSFSLQCMSNEVVGLPDDLGKFGFIYIKNEDGYFLVKRYSTSSVTRCCTGMRFGKLSQLASVSYVNSKTISEFDNGRKVLTVSMSPKLYEHAKYKGALCGNVSKYIQGLVENDTSTVNYQQMDNITKQIIQTLMNNAEKGNCGIRCSAAMVYNNSLISLTFFNENNDGPIVRVFIPTVDDMEIQYCRVTFIMKLSESGDCTSDIRYRRSDGEWMLEQARRLVDKCRTKAAKDT